MRTGRPSILVVPFTYIYVQETPNPCDLHTSIITCPSRPHPAFQLASAAPWNSKNRSGNGPQCSRSALAKINSLRCNVHLQVGR